MSDLIVEKHGCDPECFIPFTHVHHVSYLEKDKAAYKEELRQWRERRAAHEHNESCGVLCHTLDSVYGDLVAATFDARPFLWRLLNEPA